jgi:hypothetical protein
MKERLRIGIRRRDMLGIAVGSAGAALVGAVVLGTANAKSVDLANKRKARYKARYQASSAEVRNFYRVNAYPAK